MKTLNVGLKGCWALITKQTTIIFNLLIIHKLFSLNKLSNFTTQLRNII